MKGRLPVAELMKLSEVRVGDRIKPGALPWGCLGRNVVRMVDRNETGLFVCCRAGHHYLDGQIGDDGDTLVNIVVLPRQ